VKRVAVIATATSCGKTTFGQRLSERLGVPFVELDALNHVGPDWIEATPEELRAKVEPILATDAWVIDGSYRSKLGDLVLERAEIVVWLDLPMHVWLPRLLRRTFSRVVRREELWGGNRETLRNFLFSRDSLLLFALRTYRPRRRLYPVQLARFNLVRLRSQSDLEDFLRRVEPAT
jgi:adenylate kinase family enzyme